MVVRVSPRAGVNGKRQINDGSQGPEYAAPTGLEFVLGCDSTKMPRLRRYGRAGGGWQMGGRHGRAAGFCNCSRKQNERLGKNV